jgi:hypothetical protein
MNGARTLVEMGSFYEKNIIEEKKSMFLPKDTFKLATDKKPEEAQADKKAFVGKNTGPENAEGVKEIIDIKNNATLKKANFFEPQKFSQNLEKTEVQTINNFMSKSIFDKLYEDVMSGAPEDLEAKDADALGLPGETEGGAGEEVTLTLPRDVAEKLCDVLKDAVGGEEDLGDEEVGGEEGSDDLGTKDEMNEEKDKKDKKEEAKDEDAEEKKDEDEDSEGVAKEATEIKELPTSAGQSLQKKDNKVGDITKSLTSKGPGDGKTTDKVGNDGEKGHALVGAGIKGGSVLQSKNNKVPSNTSKVGQYLAGLK